MGDDFFQQLEQLQAMLIDFAPILGAYMESLVDCGFTRPEALQLVIAYQTAVVRPSVT